MSATKPPKRPSPFVTQAEFANYRAAYAASVEHSDINFENHARIVTQHRDEIAAAHRRCAELERAFAMVCGSIIFFVTVRVFIGIVTALSGKDESRAPNS